MLGVVMLGPCRTSSLFQASTHRPRWLLPRAVCANTVKRHPSPPTAPAQQPPPQQQQRHSSISAPAALVALLPAAALLTPDAAWAASLQAGLQPELPRTAALYELADLDAKTAGLLARVLQPVLAVAQLLMIVRIVLSWYPQENAKKFPWSVAVAPTEPVLGPTRRLIPPVGGVDISPIIWFALLSFTNEILVGPQGILNLLQRKL